MKRMQWIAGLTGGALLAVVVWQNLQPATFALLGWQVSAPLAVWVAGAFALGLGAGLGLGRVWRRRS